VSVGYRYISRNFEIPSYHLASDKLEYYKTGSITVDHQFLLNVGVSF